MDGDDLSGLLPKPPPPRPARRETAIAAAMRRFDGVADAPAEREHARSPLWKARWGPIGAFASILLVAVVSIPMVMETARQPSDPAPGASVPVDGSDAPRVADNPGTRDPQTVAKMQGAPVTPPATSPAPPAGEAVPRIVPPPRDVPPPRFEQTPMASMAPPPAPAAPAPPPPSPLPSARATAAEARVDQLASESAIVVTGARVRRPALDSATPAAVAEKEASRDDGDIVVSGTRSARPRAASRRGDWNACTVDDPEQSLRGCKRLVNPVAKGTAGIAAARLAEGLALAWRQDWARAIDAFDQAIALEPKLAFAYLNRGLARQREGDLSRARADLDQAVRHAPRAARGYYHRSIVRRQRGDARGAAADAARAVDLDSRYGAVVD